MAASDPKQTTIIDMQQWFFVFIVSCVIVGEFMAGFKGIHCGQ